MSVVGKVISLDTHDADVANDMTVVHLSLHQLHYCSNNILGDLRPARKPQINKDVDNYLSG